MLQGTPSAASRRRTAPAAGRRTRRGSALLFGKPASIMVPAVVFVVTVFLLTVFGLVMIYSASSVTSLVSKDTDYNAAYYLLRQGLFILAGCVAGALVYLWGYRRFRGPVMAGLTIVIFLLLGFVLTTESVLGASRWIDLGFFTLQPSEFAKLTVIVTFANLWSRYHEGDLELRRFLLLLVLTIGVTFALILRQPDKGTTMVLAFTVFVMAVMGGLENKYCWLLLAVGVVLFAYFSLKDDYSRARIMILGDPWKDATGAGYQLVQASYAFGSGGLFGVGIGSGKAKYSYLPMAYNDFIYAVIGEECGLVGALGVIAAFGVLFWAGVKIAQNAPDLTGRLIAMGSTSMLVIQMLINVAGVVGAMPLSGKPIPFISYGGSSIVSSLMTVGLVLSVVKASELPTTEYDERRQDWSVRTPDARGTGVGEATPRSRRGSAPSGGFTVLGGGRSAEPVTRGRVTRDANGRQRINLGPSAGDRLRQRQGDGPRVRGSSPNEGRGDSRGR